MKPPEDFKVKIEMDRGYEKIVISHGSGRIMRFVVAAFTIVWLGGWTFGWITAFGSLSKLDGPSEFIIFLLTGWTVGGGCTLFAIPSIAFECSRGVVAICADTCS